MSERSWRDSPLPEELEHADELLEKAEALIRKHQGLGGADMVEDLPVLTDVVDPAEPTEGTPPAAQAAPEPAAVAAAPATADMPSVEDMPATPAAIDEELLVERLIGLDAGLSRAIEAWVSDELPQILSREFDAMTERIRAEALAHLRATLIPQLSSDISAMLDPPENP